jgi:starvation-inducible DNA-binding protein
MFTSVRVASENSASKYLESGGKEMSTNNTALKTREAKGHDLITPNWRQSAKITQKFGTVVRNLPIGIKEETREEITARLNLVLADTITLRDLYKKSHWQVAGPTFYQLHLLFDKHADEQGELVDTIAERIQLLGGVSIAMAHDVAEHTRLERPPIGREEVPVQISRLLEAHNFIMQDVRELADKAQDMKDPGTNDMLISNVLRTNELQTWFISEHLVEMPLVIAQ